MSTWTPGDLGERGQALWDEITTTFQLRADEREILADACREADLLERLQAELVQSELVTRGSMGQEVAGAIVTEIRQHRTSYMNMLKALKLPDTPATSARKKSQVSEMNRKAARARWGTGAGTG